MTSGDKAFFSSTARDPGAPGYPERSGAVVSIVRELRDDERDDEVGRMYRVRFSDGIEADAFADELTPATQNQGE